MSKILVHVKMEPPFYPSYLYTWAMRGTGQVQSVRFS